MTVFNQVKISQVFSSALFSSRNPQCRRLNTTFISFSFDPRHQGVLLQVVDVHRVLKHCCDFQTNSVWSVTKLFSSQQFFPAKPAPEHELDIVLGDSASL